MLADISKKLLPYLSKGLASFKSELLTVKGGQEK